MVALSLPHIDDPLRFLGAIFDPGDLVEFSSIPSNAVRAWCRLEEALPVLEAMKAANASDNAFFGANPRKPDAGARKGGKVEDVLLARCLFVDFDRSISGESGCSVEEARQRIDEACLPVPTAVLSTGKGVHAWWRLDEPMTDLGLWRRHQRALIACLLTDGSIKNANRLMRLPGFANVKYANRPVARLVDCDPARTYDLAEFPPPSLPDERPVVRSVAPAERSLSLLAQRFIDDGYVPQGIGSRRTTMFTVACDMKARGWTLEEAVGVLVPRMRNLGLTDDEVQDCPRQIRNAFAKDRTPIDSERHPDEVEPPADHREESATEEATEIELVTADRLVELYAVERPVVIHGLLRETETMNLIAAPKLGKSHLTTDLAISVALGQPWLDTFPTEAGRVLVIDNELHHETLAVRVQRVAKARGVSPVELGGVHALCLRGRLQSIYGLASLLKQYERGAFRLVVLDAFYRFLPSDVDENSNSQMAGLYNTIDRIAERLGSAVVCIHHTSKGNQSGKGVTDVGAGAGSQSRAADTHLVLREHDESDCFVLDAATRSFPPPKARCYRRAYPIWVPAHDLDPEDLKGARPRRDRGSARMAEPAASPVRVWTAERLMGEWFTEPRTRDATIAMLRSDGVTERRAREVWEEVRNDLVMEGRRESRVFMRRGLDGCSD